MAVYTSGQNRSRPQRGSIPGLRFALFAFLSVALMFLDQRGGWLERVRYGLQAAAYPLQLAMNSPSAAWNWTHRIFEARANLQAENRRLRDTNRRLELQTLRYAALERENAQLRGLRRMLPGVAEQWLPGEVIGVESSNLRQRMTIGRGAVNGVFKAQAVISDGGLLGQTLRVGPWSTEVILISDPEHAVPVQIARNGLRTIAVGTCDISAVTLPYLPIQSDVRAGDLLVSFADSIERWEVGPARVRWRISRMLLAMDGTGTRGLAISSDVTPSPVEVIWMEDGTVRASWPEPLEGVRSAAFSPDGDTVALGRVGVVEIRETSTGAPVDQVQDPDGNAIFALAWHPAGHQIALVTPQGPHLWTLGTDTPPRRLADIPNALVSIAASPDGTRLAAVERYRNLLLLDAVTGREKHVRTEIRSPLEVAWPGMGFLAVGYERDVVWCDHETFMRRRTNSFINAHSLQGLAAARSVARVLRADSGANFTLMDSSAGRVLFSWRVDGPGPFRPLALSPEGRRAAARLGDGSMRVWATDELNPVEVGRWEDAAAVALEFDPDGEAMCGLSQRSAVGLPARVWRWIPGSSPITVDLDPAVVEPVRAAFSADCRLVLIQDGTSGIAVCDTETGHRLAQVTTETDGLLLTLGVSPTGERWWVSRVDGVAAMLSGPLWLTSPRANGSSTWEMEALGRPGPFQVEQTPGGIAPWTRVGLPQPGPRLEIPDPAGDLFWRVKTVPAQLSDGAVKAARRPAFAKP